MNAGERGERLGRLVDVAMARAITLGLCCCLAVTLTVSAFPEDVAPINIVDAKYTSRYPAFLGVWTKGDGHRHKLYFRLMVSANRTLFIAARDHVYHIDLDAPAGTEIPGEKTLTWKSKAHDKQICTMKGKQKEECHNYIKVIAPRPGGPLLVCGTNAFNPLCRDYLLPPKGASGWGEPGGVARQSGPEASGMARCPYDSTHSNVALFSGGMLYSATVTDFLASDAVIYRSIGAGPALRTLKYDSKWLKEPKFVHAVDFGNYIYYFFREIAVEHTSMGKVVFSRVARVCKNDAGGSQRVLQRHWTSFVKARLACSLPGQAGEPSFFFDELRAATDVLAAAGRHLVLAVFTTPQNSIPGSAVCAFDMDEVATMFHGRFKEQLSPEAAWTTVPAESVPQPRPGCCAGLGPAKDFQSSADFPDETLSFIKAHPLMHGLVPPVFGRPWFTRTMVRHRLTRIAADVSAGPYGNATVLYLGSEDGLLFKVLGPGFGPSVNPPLLEEIHAYSTQRCSVEGENEQEVLDLFLDVPRHVIYVAFSACIVRIPLSRCARYAQCRRSCLSARDPYCGWVSTGTCTYLSTGTSSSFEQNLETEDVDHTPMCHAGGYASVNGHGGSAEALPALATGARRLKPTTPLPTMPVPGAQHPGVLAPSPHARGQEGGLSDGHVASLFSDKSVDLTVLAACVTAAFALGAVLSGVGVYCFCGGGGVGGDTSRRKSSRTTLQAGTALRGEPTFSGAYGSSLGTSLSALEVYDAKGDCEDEACPPFLANGAAKAEQIRLDLGALPTPEATPVLPLKSQLNAPRHAGAWETVHNARNSSSFGSMVGRELVQPVSLPPPPQSSIVANPEPSLSLRAEQRLEDVFRHLGESGRTPIGVLAEEQQQRQQRQRRARAPLHGAASLRLHQVPPGRGSPEPPIPPTRIDSVQTGLAFPQPRAGSQGSSVGTRSIGGTGGAEVALPRTNAGLKRTHSLLRPEVAMVRLANTGTATSAGSGPCA
uniref:semaphorin-6A-like isoform X1 n=2 Tax=Myxine glutinosa TaxID=7769 RepID=UPI00358EA10B